MLENIRRVEVARKHRLRGAATPRATAPQQPTSLPNPRNGEEGQEGAGGGGAQEGQEEGRRQEVNPCVRFQRPACAQARV